MVEIRTIGIVKNDFKDPSHRNDFKDKESLIIIDQVYEEGLDQIEENEYIQVIYYFHLTKDYELKGNTYTGRLKGVFSYRGSKRPAAIGLSTVRLIGRKGRELTVTGLDAVDGTPVLDIKPYAPAIDEILQKKVERQHDLDNPRREIIHLIRNKKLEDLFLGASEFHGHSCSGLALGIMAGTYAINHIREMSDGMENLLAIVETNNCFADGIQYTTGCTLGNNSLIYRDYGKTAATITRRDRKGVRISVKPEFKEERRKQFPEFTEIFDKVIKRRQGTSEENLRFKRLAQKTALCVLKMNWETIFKIEKVEAEIFDYAPFYETVICSQCGEPVMAAKISQVTGKNLCIPCARAPFFQLIGKGIENSCFHTQNQD